MRYRQVDKNIPEIAGELDVTWVIEGSVLRSDEKVRITAQLVTTADGSHLWSERFDRELRYWPSAGATSLPRTRASGRAWLAASFAA